MTDALTYYAAHSAALFPIPAGQKAPFGIVGSFKHDHSRDPAQWALWQAQHPQCNFGVVAFASGWIIMDTDTSGGEEGRVEAWALRGELFTSWGLDPATLPHCQSQSGGWHDYFQVPAGVDASQLRQPDAIKKRINIRCVGFTVAAGSWFEGRPYLLMSDAPPHPAPAALVEHCTRRAPRPTSGDALPGSRDKDDVVALLLWLNEKGAFEDYESWFQIGMALRVEYGDVGFDLWELTHDGTVSPDAAAAKWNSFATEPTADSVTLATFLDRAHKLGWTGSVRRSSQSMFHGVAALAAASSPVPITMGRGAAHVRIFSPILAAVPVLARTDEHPELPDIGHPLRDAINAAIPGIIANPAEHVTALAIINLIHPQTAAKVWPITPAVLARTAFLEAEEKQALKPDDYARDPRSAKIEGDNRDNVEFYLNSIGVEYRWNAWLEISEVKGWQWPNWTRVTDAIIATLRMNASRTGTRFTMTKEFAADAILTLSHDNTVDPACDLLDKWQAAWDGMPRIDTWLSRACGVPDNAYYRAVSRIVLMGIVGRIRHPGIKFDLMMVLISPKQGTEKSSLAKVLALSNEWFVENVSLNLEPKELVLLLAGKTVAEVSEMRNRGDAEDAKAMITTTHDEGRTAYSRFSTKRARRNILIGSTNKPAFLEDATGNRRFLPVNVVGAIDLAWVRANLPQLFGEAAAGLAVEITKHNGEKIELPPEVWDLAAEYQEGARAQSDFEIYLNDWFGREMPGFIMAKDLADLMRDAIGKSVAPNQYGSIMRALGFEQDQKSKAGRVWVRGDGPRYDVKRDNVTGRLYPKQMFGTIQGAKVA